MPVRPVRMKNMPSARDISIPLRTDNEEFTVIRLNKLTSAPKILEMKTTTPNKSFMALTSQLSSALYILFLHPFYYNFTPPG
jgi:hypothetical protein